MKFKIEKELTARELAEEFVYDAKHLWPQPLVYSNDEVLVSAIEALIKKVASYTEQTRSNNMAEGRRS